MARCRKRLDAHIGVAVALTLALLADVAPAQKADVPQIKVGDRWQFVLYYSVPLTGAEGLSARGACGALRRRKRCTKAGASLGSPAVIAMGFEIIRLDGDPIRTSAISLLAPTGDIP